MAEGWCVCVCVCVCARKGRVGVFPASHTMPKICLYQVLANMDQKTMLSMVRVYESSSSPAEVLCIQGSPQLLSNLQNVSVCNARGIVILSDDSAAQSTDESDANAVRPMQWTSSGHPFTCFVCCQFMSLCGKLLFPIVMGCCPQICTMLALTKAARSAGVPLPPVSMEVHSPETVSLVRRTFGDSVYPILVGAFAAKMTVQSILMPGIANVFTNILSFDGSEFYVEPIPKYMVRSVHDCWKQVRSLTAYWLTC